MPRPVRTLTPLLARRLAVAKQRLAGPTGPVDPSGILDVVRDLGCVQLDPISVVARSHQLVLWSRLGGYSLADLDRLLWTDRCLFEYWAHAASIVMTEDYPIHRHLMRVYGTGVLQRHERLRKWIADNDALRRSILKRLRAEGPLRTQQLEDQAAVPWQSRGWTNDRNVDRMLDYLWTKGRIMVVGRPGGQKLWDLSERFLPEWTPRERLTERQVVSRAAERAVRALGVAQPAHIQQHFIRGRYPGLPAVLAQLVRSGRLVPARIADGHQAWPGPWYVHADDVPLLEEIEGGRWEPRTTLLSPFDNLICDRARTELLFGFRFRMEIYVPKPERRYGYYVLPILRGDRLIGRIDPVLDRKGGRLLVNAIHTEPGVDVNAEVRSDVSAAIRDLASFAGASTMEAGEQVEETWRRAL